jgi:hypothetical protein
MFYYNNDYNNYNKINNDYYVIDIGNNIKYKIKRKRGGFITTIVEALINILKVLLMIPKALMWALQMIIWKIRLIIYLLII